MFIVAIIILVALATAGLIFGVGNDAVNFLNSSIGSRVAPRKTIMIVASLGILTGVTFSSGMMEVARKGIFHPQHFVMPELMVIFLAVMLTNVILLDLYNTFGLPTSTTVSIVFGLLGATVPVALIKINTDPKGLNLGDYINTDKAMLIIAGILLSVVIAFLIGAFIQYITRLIFTFEYKKRLKRYGSIWSGIAMSSIVYFILIKGAKGASFMTSDMLTWIKSHTAFILLISFLAFTLLLQLLMSLFKINVLKVIILVGTFAIALAFAANDLVNFIGVPLAGLSSYEVAHASNNPLTIFMGALQKPIESNTWILLIAGAIMVVTLWTSKKANTVIKTEISLGRQDEGIERFGATPLSRVVVRMFTSVGKGLQNLIPHAVQKKLAQRLDQKHYCADGSGEDELASFDQIRASVNLVMASALIALGTSMKLPLSTTYVTFMVAMGTSLSDRAWGSESAVYRVTGVLTVIGGWFFTALMAFTVSSILAVTILYGQALSVLGIIILAGILILRNHRVHNRRETDDKETEIYNLKKLKDADYAINASFEHSGHFLQVINNMLNSTFSGLFCQNRLELKKIKKDTKKIQKWTNIITANMFKTLRLLDQQDVEPTQEYSHTIGALQEIADSMRDAILRSYTHIDNNHTGLLQVQIDELEEIRRHVSDMLEKTADALLKKEGVDIKYFETEYDKLKKLTKGFDKNQILRIQKDISKTRLSILFYGLMGDCRQIARQSLILLEIFSESFNLNSKK